MRCRGEVPRELHAPWTRSTLDDALLSAAMYGVGSFFSSAIISPQLTSRAGQWSVDAAHSSTERGDREHVVTGLSGIRGPAEPFLHAPGPAL